ncbi:MAG: ATP synthase F1 subunit epsilon [Planctomycetota bacterium]|jgi:F-type H+-transporting ATPase subunit epsilon
MSEDKTLHVDIISPEKPVYHGEALSVTAMAHDGELGILPGHAPLVTKLGIGEVRVTRGTLADKVTDTFAIKQGYLEVMDNKVVVLSEDAKAIDDLRGIDKEELERLQAELESEKDPARRAELEADISWMKSCDKLYAATK